jgi:hypothetical protein
VGDGQAWAGAFLLALTQQDAAPVVDLKEVLFSKVLQRA